ncbi:hypothetical protein GGD65_007286 [Bradyrhizobium sp. CIR18]|nr:hypothetical protein [Bradyrhizobium sp. CIR18]
MGEAEWVKVFASAEAADRWFDQHDPEGVAWEYEIEGGQRQASVWIYLPDENSRAIGDTSWAKLFACKRAADEWLERNAPFQVPPGELPWQTRSMLQDKTNLAAMAEALSRSADYRVLRRLVPRPPCRSPAGCGTRTAALLDTETTGLDHERDEIIELGMVKFDYTANGRIVRLRDTFSAFNEPSAPISEEVTALTGITDEMVAGHKIDEAAVNAFVADAVIVIAHKRGFDRKFAERYCPVFESKAWGCSATEIDWRAHGFAGAPTRLPAARSRTFPPGPQGRRRLPCAAGDPGLHVADDRRSASPGRDASAALAFLPKKVSYRSEDLPVTSACKKHCQPSRLAPRSGFGNYGADTVVFCRRA